MRTVSPRHAAAMCGCCEGRSEMVPLTIANPPGLSTIAYRVGTHASFKQHMLARLSSPFFPELSSLRKRDDADFAMALLDTWSAVADALTFYQERIANESYLRTATERRSLLELARLIGYELRPGVAASTFLAFTLEESPGVPALAPKHVPIDKGARVQSVPAPGENPQVYETIEKIEARPQWNALRPRLTRRQPVIWDTPSLLFEGLATGLKPGDGLLLVTDEMEENQGHSEVFRQVMRVELEPAQQRTKVTLDAASQVTSPTASTSTNLSSTIQFPTQKGIASTEISGPVTSAKLHASATIEGYVTSEVLAHFQAGRSEPATVLAFRVRAAIFGHNAPNWDTLPLSQRDGEYVPNEDAPPKYFPVPHPYKRREYSWADKISLDQMPEREPNQIFLDNVYPSIAQRSRVVLKSGSTVHAYTVRGVAEQSVADFTLSAKVTRVEMTSRTGFDSHLIRDTTVFAQSEELRLARVPVTEPVAGRQIELDGLVDGLRAGQSVIVCGELSELRGVRMCEHAVLTGIEHEMSGEGVTTIRIPELAHSYVRDSVTISANVARATHGESVQEVLGSGDAAASFQTMSLRQPPLTYVRASVPAGAESTLEVRVNGLEWHEVPSLFGRGPEERVFITRIEEDGATRLRFGDGKTGARLPTGRQNIRARYRKGIGVEGLVEAGQLSMLLTRPLGVRGVTNPIDAEGGADRESLADARANAPLTVMTLDRAVSLRDYEDFARAFSGVAKAHASWAGGAAGRSVFVTVAGAKGALIRPDSATYSGLVAALAAAGDPFATPRVGSYRPALFNVHARVKVDEDFATEEVLESVGRGLRERFSFDARDFGQPVMLSEVIATIQSTPGVVAVDIDRFERTDNPRRPVGPRLDAALPRVTATGEWVAAELLTLNPSPLELQVMS